MNQEIKAVFVNTVCFSFNVYNFHSSQLQKEF